MHSTNLKSKQGDEVVRPQAKLEWSLILYIWLRKTLHCIDMEKNHGNEFENYNFLNSFTVIVWLYFLML